MPANNDISIKGNNFYHIYNKGIENGTVFRDDEDYKTILLYLEEYVSPRQNKENSRKTFTVQGKSYRGVPHQPQNYQGQVELAAYSLMPDHFHLLVNEIKKSSLERFMRSLFTRYSMYFNKKYKRTGALFEGPYKSVKIQEPSQLYPLVAYIHHGANNYSSYSEYSGNKRLGWVNTNFILPFKNSISGLPEKELLKGITFEDKVESAENLARRDPARIVVNSPPSRAPEIVTLFAIFLVLVGFGIRNIKVSEANTIAVAETPVSNVLSESIKPTDSPTLKNVVVIKIPNNLSFINIRLGPTSNSVKVGEAVNDDSFEFVSVDSGWYQVKLADGSTGYISSKYSYLQETNNE